MAEKTKSKDVAFADAKCAQLMAVFGRMMERHFKGETHLDEETFRLWNVAKGINWAKDNDELLRATASIRRTS